ncbi:MAG: dihydropteroate synthase [SAR324 cluster bacterium]|nr:dihydropteroate synthase [SAR324 cluster bacterium]
MLDLRTLGAILERYGDALRYPVRPLEVGGRRFDFERRRMLVGVINLSPDSWYRESVCESEAEAIERGLRLVREGADLVDIGAESSLPHSKRVGPGEQIERIVPVVRALATEGILVSVESYYPEVLAAAAEAGARVFNLTGNEADADVLKLAARHKAAVVFCYVQGGHVRDVADFALEEDMLAEMEAHFRRRTARAARMGVANCILDPGLGFYYGNFQDGALRVEHQLNTLLQTFRLNRLGYPTMNILPHAQEIFGEEERRAAEPFFAVLALLGGTHIVRTHELRTVAKIRAVLEGFGAD